MGGVSGCGYFIFFLSIRLCCFSFSFSYFKMSKKKFHKMMLKLFKSDFCFFVLTTLWWIRRRNKNIKRPEHICVCEKRRYEYFWGEEKWNKSTGQVPCFSTFFLLMFHLIFFYLFSFLSYSKMTMIMMMMEIIVNQKSIIPWLDHKTKSDVISIIMNWEFLRKNVMMIDSQIDHIDKMQK